jgi:hypothetical protein
MRKARLALLGALALAGTALAQPADFTPDLDRLPAGGVRRYHLARPTAAELRYRAIPWEVDLGKAVQTARREGRPLFLWASGDDPLERC